MLTCPLSHAVKKSFKLLEGYHQLLSGFRAKGNLPRVSRQLGNDKGDNEMIPQLCTDLLAFALQLRKTPENLS